MNTANLVGQILFLSGVGLFGMILARLTRLDLTLACLGAGVLAGALIPFLNYDSGLRASNFHDLVFYIILPILIFEAAWYLEPKRLRKWLVPSLLFATIGLMICSSLIALGAYFGINSPTGFPWVAALLTGAILSATDPVAVVAALHRLKAPADLSTLIEGESLFNDATAVVLFAGLLSFAAGEPTAGPGEYIGEFAVVFIGGGLAGALAGLLAAILALLLGDRSKATVVLVMLAFGSFYVAEHILHVSGIMAVVAAAICSKRLLAEHEDQLLSGIGLTWSWLGQLFTALIFVLMGLAIELSMFSSQWLAMLIAIVVAVSARFITVFLVSPVCGILGHAIPVSWQLVLSWGGLRGAIAIALVLTLPTSLPYWWTIQSMVFGVVLFSLLVQGTSCAPLIKRADGNSAM